MCEMLIPLLKAQSYIEDATIWNGEHIDVNLNKIRETPMNQSAGILSRWYFWVFPNLACDISKPYLEMPYLHYDYAVGKILVNRTIRYHNPFVRYNFLKDYESDLLFTGTKQEHEIFCDRWALSIPYLEISNFYQLAQAIAQCRFLLGNQSMPMQIAEGLKTPRMVEVCQSCPNVIPIGGEGYDFVQQVGAEYYFNFLYGKSSHNPPHK